MCKACIKLLSSYQRAAFNNQILKYCVVLVARNHYFFIINAYRQIFCDFGESFTVSDVTGEQPHSVIISSISKVTSCHVYNNNIIIKSYCIVY